MDVNSTSAASTSEGGAPPARTIRVLLADDHPVYRVGLSSVLNSDPEIEVVAEARDVDEVLQKATSADPDVLCIDAQMSVAEGLESIRRLSEGGQERAVLILTSSADEETLLQALQSGATGVVLKSVSPHELVAAVKTVTSGGALFDSSLTRTMVDLIRRQAEQTAPARVDVAPVSPPALVDGHLSGREVQVLRGMARGMTNAEIADELFLGESTVKSHVSSILAKTGVRDRVQAVLWALHYGVVERSPHPPGLHLIQPGGQPAT